MIPIKTNFLILLLVLLAFIGTENIYTQQASDKIVVDGKVRFTVISPECIRLEFSESGKFIDSPSLFAANRNTNFAGFNTKNEIGKTIIETSRFKLVYKQDGKSFAPENLEVLINKGNEQVKWFPGKVNAGNLGGTIRTLDAVKGKVPLDDGLLSRDGWFLLDDSKRPILTEDWVASRLEGSGIDWYLFAYGNDFKAALKSFTKIGGEVPLPRKYSLGSWYSRYWPYSSDDYRQLVKEYEQYNFPLDIMVLDMDWHRAGWTGWSWNRELLPDAEDLLSWFHQKKIFVTLNLHPAQGVQPHEDAYKDFMKDMNVDLTNVPKDKLPTIPYDASNKKYLDNLFKNTHLPLEKQGVDFWWLDWQQFEFTLGNKDLKNLEWLNNYYFNYAKKDNKRGISFSRWGGWGDHKHPIHFSGDASSHWEMLEFEIPFTSTAGNVGCFFWSHDIGGHWGGINPETNARWIQFGATSAALRLHSTRDKTMDKRPWLFEEKFLSSMREAFHLRSIIFPYIYSSAWQSCNESIPLNRPMYIEYPEKEEAYHSPRQYFFGEAFLCAPITQPGIGKNNLANQKVWFPKGIWYNWFSGEKYTGDEKTQTVWADIYEFPFYAKGGIPIPIQPYTQRMTTEPLKELVVRTYPGEDGKSGEFILYEDDGISQEYQKGKFATTKIQYLRIGNEYQVKIFPTEGRYEGQLLKRSYAIEFPCLQKAKEAFVNGKSFKIECDEENFSNKVLIPETSIEEAITISLNAKEIDYSIVQKKSEKKRISGLTDEIDFKKPVEEILQGYIDKNQDQDQDKKEGMISLLSGVSFYVEDSNRITIVKNPGSIADSEFEIKIVDENKTDSKDVIKEQFNLGKGESKVISINSVSANSLPITRKAELKFFINGKHFTMSRILEKKIPYICNWQIVGPFYFDPSKNISDFVYGPEKDFNPGTSYTADKGETIKWREVKCEGSPLININNYFDKENSIAYAAANLKSEEAQVIVFNVNSDDGVEIWLNKEKIHSNNAFRGVEDQTDKVMAKLKKGTNMLLVKISQGSGGWAFKINYECLFPVEVLIK
ncbi:MAG: DUF5110 domain-containing protein [Ignavibacteriales bacterium]|nr:DUF5110 domain-containing protein [Ignavibacteriales bacterium]